MDFMVVVFQILLLGITNIFGKLNYADLLWYSLQTILRYIDESNIRDSRILLTVYDSC
jgi:hypothetical protein